MRFLICMGLSILVAVNLHANAIAGNFSNTNKKATLNIFIQDVKSIKGIMYLVLCSKDAFNKSLKEKDYTNCLVKDYKPISVGEKYNFVFKDIPFGEWAIFGFIDENFNKKLDTNFIGIPKEPVIFKVRLKRKPSFDVIKTVVDQTNQEVILIAQ